MGSITMIGDGSMGCITIKKDNRGRVDGQHYHQERYLLEVAAVVATYLARDSICGGNTSRGSICGGSRGIISGGGKGRLEATSLPDPYPYSHPDS